MHLFTHPDFPHQRFKNIWIQKKSCLLTAFQLFTYAVKKIKDINNYTEIVEIKEPCFCSISGSIWASQIGQKFQRQLLGDFMSIESPEKCKLWSWFKPMPDPGLLGTALTCSLVA